VHPFSSIYTNPFAPSASRPPLLPERHAPSPNPPLGAPRLDFRHILKPTFPSPRQLPSLALAPAPSLAPALGTRGTTSRSTETGCRSTGSGSSASTDGSGSPTGESYVNGRGEAYEL
jgi:hypothetical protein